MDPAHRSSNDASRIGAALNRVSSIADDAAGTDTLATYTYQGGGTVTSTARPEVTGGMTLDHDTANNNSLTGWDRFGRVTDHAWRTTTSGVIDGYGYTYNPAGNRTAKSNLDNSVFNETYTFDGLDRLAASTRNSVNLQSWNLDPLGNWASTTRGTAAAETRSHNAANEITGIAAASPIAYDNAGNTIADADHTYVYDAWNRLVKVIDATTAATVATYEYDGRNFRIERVIGSDTFDDYHNDGWQLLETQKNGVVSEQYVYDLRYIDSVVLRDRDTTANGALDERLYYAQDAQFNVTALVDTTGAVVERYAYTPYGTRTVFNASWGTLISSAYNNVVSYTGQRLDVESSLHYFRNRYYSANLGRFITRDPLGYVDGMSLYGAMRNNPGYFTDPSGHVSYTAAVSGEVGYRAGITDYRVVIEIAALWVGSKVDGSDGEKDAYVMGSTSTLNATVVPQSLKFGGGRKTKGSAEMLGGDAPIRDSTAKSNKKGCSIECWRYPLKVIFASSPWTLEAGIDLPLLNNVSVNVWSGDATQITAGADGASANVTLGGKSGVSQFVLSLCADGVSKLQRYRSGDFITTLADDMIRWTKPLAIQRNDVLEEVGSESDNKSKPDEFRN